MMLVVYGLNRAARSMSREFPRSGGSGGPRPSRRERNAKRTLTLDKESVRRNARRLVRLFNAGVRRFPESRLAGANLSGLNLSGVDLQGADLRGADLSGADLTGALLFDADLTGADLTGAILLGADIHNATLDGADLRGAMLVHPNPIIRRLEKKPIYMYMTKLRGATLDGAHLAAIGTERVDLTDATIDGVPYAEFSEGLSVIKAEIAAAPDPKSVQAFWDVMAKAGADRAAAERDAAGLSHR